MTEIKENRHLIVLTFISFIFVVAAIVSSLYTSKANDIQKEQYKLIRANILLREQIQSKKAEYESIKDKIEDIEELIGKNSSGTNKNVSKLLKTLSFSTKKLIIKSIPSGYPLNSRRITSKFGYRIHPIYKNRRFHHGVDFGGKIGMPIKATADGIVEFADFDKGYGNLVVLSHNYGFKTAYGHMLKNLKVKKGDFVKKGDLIGYLGNTGLSTGPHLHYEVKYIKNVLNPIDFLNFDIKHFDSLFYAQDRVAWDSLVRAIMNDYSKVKLARL
jgi:murein DD-endopeptidase MepM/ murein hydrolase activator NlpD